MPRRVGDWTRDKLKILELYLPPYLQATTRALERVYVDAFAGPGLNLLERTQQQIDGSPLVALKAAATNGTRFSRFFFIDEDGEALDELRGHIGALGLSDRCTLLYGNVNDRLPEVMRRINKRSPTFVFLDTDGIEPKWTTIEAIASWQVELLVNFPLGMSINRNERSPKTLGYFGTEEAVPLLNRRDSGRTRALLDLYKRRLTNLGFGYTTEDDRLIKTENNQRLYYLLFVSKVFPAQTIMNWVFKQPNSRGQSRLPF
jgi:three-Cys-motif partner protein